jgi:hypothetical protein
LHAFIQEGGHGTTLNINKASERVIPTSENLENELHDDNSNAHTREVGCGTTYVIRSFCNPDNDNRLCCEAIFDTKTTKLIKLQDNLAVFILQSYESSDLDDN